MGFLRRLLGGQPQPEVRPDERPESQDLGDRRGVAYSLDGLAGLARDRGDSRAARELYERSLAARREVGDRPGAQRTLRALATMARAAGDHARARALYDESLALEKEESDTRPSRASESG